MSDIDVLKKIAANHHVSSQRQHLMLCTAGLCSSHELAEDSWSFLKARIKELMKLNIEQIRGNASYSQEHAEGMVSSAIEVQETWEKYASAKSRESAAWWGNGSGGPFSASRAYLDLQVERIKDLLPVYK